MNLQWKGKREGKGRMLPRESRTQRKCNRKHDTRVGGILLTKDRLKGRTGRRNCKFQSQREVADVTMSIIIDEFK